jgi:hypothetical protein
MFDTEIKKGLYEMSNKQTDYKIALTNSKHYPEDVDGTLSLKFIKTTKFFL